MAFFIRYTKKSRLKLSTSFKGGININLLDDPGAYFPSTILSFDMIKFSLIRKCYESDAHHSHSLHPLADTVSAHTKKYVKGSFSPDIF